MGLEVRIAIGSDHAGFDLKEGIKRQLLAAGHMVEDFGTHSNDSVDYPDYARSVGLAVAQGQQDRGILICGTGIGMSIAANKIKGVRAALCHEPFSARITRADNDSNVLIIGSRVTGPALAAEIVQVWLESPFTGGRHQRRVDKISRLEEEFGQQAR